MEEALETHFGNFVSSANLKIDIVLNYTTEQDFDLLEVLKTGTDATFDFTVEVIAALSVANPLLIIAAIMEWSRRQNNALNVKWINRENGSSAERFNLIWKDRKKSVFAYFICVLIEKVVSKLNSCSEELAQVILDIIMSQISKISPGQLSKAGKLHFKAVANLLTKLSALKYTFCINRILSELNTDTYKNNPLFIKLIAYISIQIYPQESLEVTLSSLVTLSDAFKCCSNVECKISFAFVFINVLSPAIEDLSVEPNLVRWSRSMETIYEKAFRMCSKPKYMSSSFPLIVAITCASKRDFFLQKFSIVVDLLLSKLKERNLKKIVGYCLNQMVWAFLFKHSDSANNTRQKLESLFKSVFTSITRRSVIVDPALYSFSQMIYFVSIHWMDFGLDHLIFNLVKDFNAETYSIEKFILGIRSFSFLIQGLVTKKFSPRFPFQPFLMTTEEIKTDFIDLDEGLPSLDVHIIEKYGLSTRFSSFSSVIGKLLLIGDRFLIQEFSQSDLNGVKDNSAMSELICSCLGCIPLVTPSFKNQNDLINLLIRFGLNERYHRVANVAFSCINRVAENALQFDIVNCLLDQLDTLSSLNFMFIQKLLEQVLVIVQKNFPNTFVHTNASFSLFLYERLFTTALVFCFHSTQSISNLAFDVVSFLHKWSQTCSLPFDPLIFAFRSPSNLVLTSIILDSSFEISKWGKLNCDFLQFLVEYLPAQITTKFLEKMSGSFHALNAEIANDRNSGDKQEYRCQWRVELFIQCRCLHLTSKFARIESPILIGKIFSIALSSVQSDSEIVKSYALESLSVISSELSSELFNSLSTVFQSVNDEIRSAKKSSKRTKRPEIGKCDLLRIIGGFLKFSSGCSSHVGLICNLVETIFGYLNDNCIIEYSFGTIFSFFCLFVEQVFSIKSFSLKPETASTMFYWFEKQLNLIPLSFNTQKRDSTPLLENAVMPNPEEYSKYPVDKISKLIYRAMTFLCQDTALNLDDKIRFLGFFKKLSDVGVDEINTFIACGVRNLLSASSSDFEMIVDNVLNIILASSDSNEECYDVCFLIPLLNTVTQNFLKFNPNAAIKVLLLILIKIQRAHNSKTLENCIFSLNTMKQYSFISIDDSLTDDYLWNLNHILDDIAFNNPFLFIHILNFAFDFSKISNKIYACHILKILLPWCALPLPTVTKDEDYLFVFATFVSLTIKFINEESLILDRMWKVLTSNHHHSMVYSELLVGAVLHFKNKEFLEIVTRIMSWSSSNFLFVYSFMKMIMKRSFQINLKFVNILNSLHNFTCNDLNISFDSLVVFFVSEFTDFSFFHSNLCPLISFLLCMKDSTDLILKKRNAAFSKLMKSISPWYGKLECDSVLPLVISDLIQYCKITDHSEITDSIVLNHLLFENDLEKSLKCWDLINLLIPPFKPTYLYSFLLVLIRCSNSWGIFEENQISRIFQIITTNLEHLDFKSFNLLFQIILLLSSSSFPMFVGKSIELIQKMHGHRKGFSTLISDKENSVNLIKSFENGFKYPECWKKCLSLVTCTFEEIFRFNNFDDHSVMFVISVLVPFMFQSNSELTTSILDFDIKQITLNIAQLLSDQDKFKKLAKILQSFSQNKFKVLNDFVIHFCSETKGLWFNNSYEKFLINSLWIIYHCSDLITNSALLTKFFEINFNELLLIDDLELASLLTEFIRRTELTKILPIFSIAVRKINSKMVEINEHKKSKPIELNIAVLNTTMKSIIDVEKLSLNFLRVLANTLKESLEINHSKLTSLESMFTAAAENQVRNLFSMQSDSSLFSTSRGATNITRAISIGSASLPSLSSSAAPSFSLKKDLKISSSLKTSATNGEESSVSIKSNAAGSVPISSFLKDFFRNSGGLNKK